jgi:hypothetical protein
MKKEERQKFKNNLLEIFSNDIANIEERIKNRKMQFDYENAKDEEKLNELSIKVEGITGLKP